MTRENCFFFHFPKRECLNREFGFTSLHIDLLNIIWIKYPCETILWILLNVLKHSVRLWKSCYFQFSLDLMRIHFLLWFKTLKPWRANWELEDSMSVYILTQEPCLSFNEFSMNMSTVFKTLDSCSLRCRSIEIMGCLEINFPLKYLYAKGLVIDTVSP